MLREEVKKDLMEKIKDINREKNIDDRLTRMINLLDETRALVNDELDEIFSSVNLQKKKLNLED